MKHYKSSPVFIKAAEQLVEAYLSDPMRPRLAPEVVVRYVGYVNATSKSPTRCCSCA